MVELTYSVQSAVYVVQCHGTVSVKLKAWPWARHFWIIFVARARFEPRPRCMSRRSYSSFVACCACMLDTPVRRHLREANYVIEMGITFFCTLSVYARIHMNRRHSSLQ